MCKNKLFLLDNEVNNPWTEISWEKCVLDCDANFICSDQFMKGRFKTLNDYTTHINERNGANNINLRFDSLPEPFSGNKNSQVYCLNLNPGEPDPFFGREQDINRLYERLCKKNLSHSQINPIDKKLVSDNSKIVEDMSLYDKIINCQQKKALHERICIDGFSIHNGEWWLKRMMGIIKMQDIFFIEYFPYHSNKAFNFPPNLPSYDYRDYLIKTAIKEEKTIIILRGFNRWLKDKRIGKVLNEYHKTFILYSNRGIHFNLNNIYKVLSEEERVSLDNLFK